MNVHSCSKKAEGGCAKVKSGTTQSLYIASDGARVCKAHVDRRPMQKSCGHHMMLDGLRRDTCAWCGARLT